MHKLILCLILSPIRCWRLIKERGLIDDLQYEEVVQEQTRTGKPIGQILNDLALSTPTLSSRLIAEHLGTDTVEIREQDLTPDIIQTMPAATARMYECVPVAVFGSTVQVAFVDPLNPEAIDQLGFAIGQGNPGGGGRSSPDSKGDGQVLSARRRQRFVGHS